MLTLSVPKGDEGSAMVARLPRLVCGVRGVGREAAGASRYWESCCSAAAVFGAAPDASPHTSGARRAVPGAGPYPSQKPRAAASASGPLLGTRYRGEEQRGATTGTCVRL